MTLSEKVAELEEKLRVAENAVRQTKYVVVDFIENYDAYDHEKRMPADRSVHTLPLKKLIRFIS